MFCLPLTHNLPLMALRHLIHNVEFPFSQACKIYAYPRRKCFLVLFRKPAFCHQIPESCRFGYIQISVLNLTSLFNQNFLWLSVVGYLLINIEPFKMMQTHFHASLINAVLKETVSCYFTLRLVKLIVY